MLDSLGWWPGLLVGYSAALAVVGLVKMMSSWIDWVGWRAGTEIKIRDLEQRLTSLEKRPR